MSHCGNTLKTESGVQRGNASAEDYYESSMMGNSDRTTMLPIFYIVKLFSLILGLGGTENTTSVLRYGRDKQEVARSPTSLLLSDDEFRHFYISIDPRKPIQVGEVGKKPMLKHKAEVPFHVNFVGFATGNGVDGVFEFCTFGKAYKDLILKLIFLVVHLVCFFFQILFNLFILFVFAFLPLSKAGTIGLGTGLG